MDFLWHPLSAVLLEDPRCFATPYLLKMLLAPSTGVLYAGDRMWPAVEDGQRLEVVPPATPPAVGDVVLVDLDGAVDLFRVAGVAADGLDLCADADPDTAFRAAATSVLATCPALRGDVPDRRQRARHRRRLDLREALHETPDEAEDAASTVLDKYDFQAPHYARIRSRAVPDPLLDRLRAAGPPPGRLLVIGSGVGRECFELEQAGWSITGIDFSPRMIELARARGEETGRSSEFVLGDVRRHEFPDASFGLAFTTFDVYSFFPREDERIAVLRRVRRWLKPRGSFFVSARLTRGAYGRSLAGKFRRGRPWGASHTRWIDGGGRVRRSFVQLFTPDRIAHEFAQAGFQAANWQDGYTVLTDAPGPRTA